MALAFSSSTAIRGSVSFSSDEPTEGMQCGCFQRFDPPYFIPVVANVSKGWLDIKPLSAAKSKRIRPIVSSAARIRPIVSSAATTVVPEVGDNEVEVEDYDKLAFELQDASPLEIMDKALATFGNDIAIAFSGAEDVALIEYARLTGRPFRVFSLDTGRLNPETYKFFDEVESVTAMEGSYVELAEKLAGSGVKVGKFRADGDHKAFAKQELQLVSFPTILFFPKHSSMAIKYPSEKRDVDSLLTFVKALR